MEVFMDSDEGFLSADITGAITHFRAENADWFKIAEDLNTVLMRTAKAATSAVKTTSMTPEAVAVRVLLRSCGTLQGVILLTERGMVAEGRILARGLIENAFCIAALHDNPEAFIEMLKKDSEASRHLQRKFIVAQDLIASGAKRDKLQAAIDEMEKPAIMSPKKVAELGPLVKMYLAYQRLSDDAAHPSAKSLDRHVLTDEARTGWKYIWGPGDQGENATTLHYALLAAISIGVGITQMLKDMDNNAEFGDLSNRFDAMPPVSVM
jgi:hypothetical protein